MTALDLPAIVDARLSPLARRVALAAAGVALTAIVLRTTWVLPKTTPAGIVVLGLVLGSLDALLAIGLILVYRTNKIINFAHGELGAFAGVLSAQLIASHVPYLVSVPVGIAAGLVGGGLVEVFIVRRFAKAPRMLLTVATIGLASILVFAELEIPTLFSRKVLSSNFRTPFSGWRFSIDSSVIFDGNYVVVGVAVVAAAIGLGLFFRSRYGVAVRAAAEDGDRAALCGIPTKRLSTIVWIIAGGLSAAAAILRAPVIGLQVGVLIGPGLLLRALAAAVIGRMQNIPAAVAGALMLGVLQQAVYWSFSESSIIDVVVLGVILAVLLAQRKKLSRSDVDGGVAVVAEVRPIPAELARLREVRIGRPLLVGAFGLAVVLLPAHIGDARQNLTSLIAIFALVGVSLVVLTGWAGQVSLGQFALVAIGACTAGTLTADHRADLLVSLLAGGAAAALVALLLGLPALRIRGLYLAVTTLAFAVTTSTFLLRQQWLLPSGEVTRPFLFGRIDLDSELAYCRFCIAVLVLCIVAVRSLRGSRTGRAIVGVRDNERAAQAYGVDATAAKLWAFAISGFLAGIAGGLLVHLQHGVPTGQLGQYTPEQSLSVFLLAVIGGLGSVPGAVLGAVYVKGAQYLLAGPAAFLASGVGVLVLLLLLPGGLGSLLYGARDAILRRLARRRGIVVASLVADLRVEPDDGDIALDLPVPVGAPT